MGKRHAVLIGNQAFEEAVSGLKPLRGPRNDVAALAEIFAAEERGGFTVETLLDAPHHAIEELLDPIVGASAPDDLLLIFYAGHGVWSRSEFYLATANTRHDRVFSSSLSTSRLAGLLKQYLGTVVVLLDCCYSGGAAGHFTRGDTASALNVFAEQVRGCYVLTSSTAIETAQEVEEDGLVLGRFTAAIRRGLLSGDAAPRGEELVRFTALRAWVERELRGQTPQQAIASGAQGDPIIARVPRGGREHRRLATLGRWLDTSEITAQEHAEMSAALLGPPDAKGVRALRDLLDQPNAQAIAVVAAWRVAQAGGSQRADNTQAKGQAGRIETPPETGGEKDVQPPPNRSRSVATPRYGSGWQLLPLSLIAGAPAGLMLANTGMFGSDWPLPLVLCGAGVFAASLLAGWTAAWTSRQAALRLFVSLAAMVVASAAAIRESGDGYAFVLLLLGLVGGVTAWRIVGLPLDFLRATEGGRPLLALFPAAAAALIGVGLLIMLARVLGPSTAFRVARYPEQEAGAVVAALIVAVAVPCVVCITAVLRQSRKVRSSAPTA